MSSPVANGAVVSATGLVKHYEGGRIHALDGLDLSVGAGEFIAVCGPSGCGKSTLLNMLAGIDRPDRGTLHVAGEDLSRLGVRELDAFRTQRVGIVFQLHNLLPNLTALENVQIPMLPTQAAPKDRVARARELLALVGLTERERARPATMSGGERQRVAIARALANEPEILLADEPTGALDSKNSGRLLDLLEQLQRDLNTTLIVVTHDEHLAARAGHVVHMLDGRITNGA
jgi:lipoprotein-releasing system ATP-binding protein